MKRRKEFEDLEEDIRNHVEEETAENIARGMAPADARFAALRKFGNVLQVQEAARAVWIPVWIDQLGQDCRYALRAYRKNKAFSATIILTIALGIGINTALFSIANAILLRPLPYPDSARLVAFSDGVTAGGSEPFKQGVVGADFAQWREQAKSFQHLAGYSYHDSTLATPGAANRVRVAVTAGDFWPLTGAQPVLGRTFAGTDRQDVIILSHSVFLRQFGGDREIVGKSTSLGGRQVEIIGVLPPDFQFLFPQDRPGFDWREVDVYIPSPPLLRSDRSRLLVAGRLNAGASPEIALGELKGIQESNLRSYPDRWFAGVVRMSLQPLREKLAGSAGQSIVILQAAGLFVLLIACANIANLLLARTAARQREFSIRVALGAGIGRVFRQFFAEGLVLAVFGAAAGLLLANGLIASMRQWGVNAMPRLAEAGIDARVIAFTIGVSLLSAMLFCFGPAAAIWRAGLQSALKDRSGAAAATFGRLNLRRCLVAAELALAVVPLTGAGLMMKSFWIMRAQVPGFEPEKTLVLQMSFTQPQYKERARLVAQLDRIVERIRALPGIQAAGVCERQGYLLQTTGGSPAFVDRFDESLVSPGYFAAMGMRLTAGRWLEAGDAADAALINETMARRAFGGRDPLGQEIGKLGRPVRVIGVVANLKYAKLDAEPPPELFRGYTDNIAGLPAISVVAKVRGDPLAIAAAARAQIAAIDPRESIHGIQTLEDALSGSVAPRRFNLILLVSFAAVALLMAIVGIYGVISYSVTQRTREIGIRLALGARPWSVTAMLIEQGMRFTAAGIAAGLAAAHMLTRWMASLLYAVQPNDPSIFAGVTLLFAAVAFLACAIPAFSAAQTDPLRSLRHE